jgi:hypothetical protein
LNREFWRELAGLITLFDQASPVDISVGEIREFLGNGAPAATRTR